MDEWNCLFAGLDSIGFLKERSNKQENRRNKETKWVGNSDSRVKQYPV